MALPHSVVDEADGSKQDEYCCQCSVHRKACCHEQVMDVILVGNEYSTPRYPSLEEDAHDIHCRYQHQGDGDEHLFLTAVYGGNGAHETLDAHIGAHIPKEETAGIAHKHLHPSHTPKDVETEEYHQSSDNGSTECCNDGTCVAGEDIGVSRKNEYAQTR